ncbi:Putative ATP-dependent helicase IRC3 [Savitreella phatthalungensis]
MPVLIYRAFTQLGLHLPAKSRLSSSSSFPKPTLQHNYATAAAPRAAPTLKLRSYQEECIQSCLAALRAGKRRMAVSLATGSGKTVIFTQLMGRIPDEGRRTRSLVLVHRKELVDQAFAHANRVYAPLGRSIEIEMGDSHATGQADITICSIQSLIRRLGKYDSSRVKLLLIDEAHHAAAASYIRVLEHFHANKPDADCVIVGVSATLLRRDGLRLADAFDHIAYHRDFGAMIRDGWLCPVRFTAVEQRSVDLSNVKVDNFGEFDARQLADRVNTVTANTTSVRAWIDRASATRRSTIVFAVSIDHATDLANCFRAHGVDARVVTSRHSRLERESLTESFRRGEFPVLINIGIFTEGFDMPSIDCVLLCRPTRSRGLLLQMIGRGMRLFEGKADCHIIDMTSCLGAGVVSVPTLHGLDPAMFVGEEVSSAELEAKEKEVREQASHKDTSSLPAQVKVRYTDYESADELMDELHARGDRHIATLSPLAWVSIGPDKYVLNLGARSYLRLLRDDDDGELWECTETRKLSQEWSTSPLARPKRLFERCGFERAVEMASSYATEHAGGARVPTLLRNSSWRRAPATPKQLILYRKLNPHLTDKDLRPLTAGEVSDYLTRRKHGAKSAADKLIARQKRQDRQLRKDRIRHPDDIQVGPLAAGS